MQGKKIIIGVTGGIAAYKSASLVREVVKRGGEVRVLMTAAAKQFITPLTMATLSKSPVLTEFFNPENGQWNSHVSLGTWADAMIIAPATANTLAKMAAGIADNLLLTTYLSARCPVMVAPAMDVDMMNHAATEQNLKTLAERGVRIVEPEAGELASGLVGKGRMAEPETIYDALVDMLTPKSDVLRGVRVMVTAGPTYEKIDPVRFIGNYSSGKMGFAIAEELASRGAQVDLVAGPVKLKTKHKNIKRYNVESADEMCRAAEKLFPLCTCAIMSAAVADYSPEKRSGEKIKRATKTMTVKLRATNDIAARLGEAKTQRQTLVGFALETTNENVNAQTKLAKKNLDFIVLNSLRDEGAGFMTDTNKITIIERSGQQTAYPLKDKKAVAADIVNCLEKYVALKKRKI